MSIVVCRDCGSRIISGRMCPECGGPPIIKSVLSEEDPSNIAKINLPDGLKMFNYCADCNIETQGELGDCPNCHELMTIAVRVDTQQGNILGLLNPRFESFDFVYNSKYTHEELRPLTIELLSKFNKAFNLRYKANYPKLGERMFIRILKSDFQIEQKTRIPEFIKESNKETNNSKPARNGDFLFAKILTFIILLFFSSQLDIKLEGAVSVGRLITQTLIMWGLPFIFSGPMGFNRRSYNIPFFAISLLQFLYMIMVLNR